MIVAHSAPISVVVDDQPTRKAEAVPELVAYQRSQLQDFLTVSIEPEGVLVALHTSIYGLSLVLTAPAALFVACNRPALRAPLAWERRGLTDNPQIGV